LEGDVWGAERRFAEEVGKAIWISNPDFSKRGFDFHRGDRKVEIPLLLEGQCGLVRVGDREERTGDRVTQIEALRVLLQCRDCAGERLHAAFEIVGFHAGLIGRSPAGVKPVRPQCLLGPG